MTDLHYASATDLIALINAKKLSPVEVMQAIVAQTERHNGSINAFATLCADQAMAEARAAEARLAKGEDIGPLAGMPVTIKDLALAKGLPVERGSHTQKGVVAQEDAPFVDRLKHAGGIVLGKTTVSEFGWSGISHAPLTGITSNPWKRDYNAGASSAGAGAAAAAGFGALHQGGDGAGSIRMPAHFSGVFGLKPTFGRVPYWPVPNGDQSAHIGPITRTVADAALMLRIMAGPYALDHQSLEAAPANYPAMLKRDFQGVRIAYSPDLGHARVDDDVAACVRNAAGAFTDLGATVEEVRDDFWRDGAEIVRSLWPMHLLYLTQYFPEFENRMEPGLVACIRHGMGHTAEDYLQARARKLAYVEKIHRFFTQWDFLLTPAVSVAAFPADLLMPAHWPQHEWDWISWAEFSYPFNFSGSPAASVPCGFTDRGLPVGLQIVGRRFDDLGVLQLSHGFEQARPWADKHPDL